MKGTNGSFENRNGQNKPLLFWWGSCHSGEDHAILVGIMVVKLCLLVFQLLMYRPRNSAGTEVRGGHARHLLWGQVDPAKTLDGSRGRNVSAYQQGWCVFESSTVVAALGFTLSRITGKRPLPSIMPLFKLIPGRPA